MSSDTTTGGTSQNCAIQAAEHRSVSVVRADGVCREIDVVDGQLFVCRGCCCGQTEKGFPELPLDDFKREWKRRGIRKRIHLTVSGCLGPCQLANVALIVFAGRFIWLHSINSPGQVKAIYDYLDSMIARGDYLPPTGDLAERRFTRYASDVADEE